MNSDLSVFYENSKRLQYNPSSCFIRKRTGIKRLVAFEDRFEEVKKVLEKLIAQKDRVPLKVLDIGVGDGIYEAILGNYFRERCEFFGIDISKEQAARAKKYLKEIKIIDINSKDLPYKNNYFDIVIVSEILEHVFYPEKVLNEAQRVLKRNGFMIITFPNSSSLQFRLGVFFKGSSPLLNYPENREHIRFFTSSDIQRLMNGNIRLLKKTGLGSFLFDKWNFLFKIPMPRLLQILGNKLLPNLALGNLLILQKK